MKLKKYAKLLPRRHVAIGACKHALKKHYIDGHKLVWEGISLIVVFIIVMIFCAYRYDNQPIVLLNIELCCVAVVLLVAVCRLISFALSPECQNAYLEEVTAM